jgi:hypothetical protein
MTCLEDGNLEECVRNEVTEIAYDNEETLMQKQCKKSGFVKEDNCVVQRNCFQY